MSSQRIPITQVTRAWNRLCLEPARTVRLINSLMKYMMSKNRYIVMNEPGYTTNGSIHILINRKESETIMEDHAGLLLDQVNLHTFISRALAMNSQVGIDLYYVVVDSPFEHARQNGYHLIKFAKSGIFDYTRLLAKWPHNESLLMAMYHPKRIQKWIEGGNDLEDYLQ